MIFATEPDPRILTYFEREPMPADSINAHRLWKAASGHPGGWRVVRAWPNYPKLEPPGETLEGKTGRLILFRSYQSAAKRADELNKLEETTHCAKVLDSVT